MTGPGPGADPSGIKKGRAFLAVGAVLFFSSFLSMDSPLKAAAPLPQSVIFLPLQDRTGDSNSAQVVEEELRAEMSRRGWLAPADPAIVRAALRRNRLRNSGSMASRHLQALAKDLRADFFFSATLHMSEGRDTPQVILSGRLMEAGKKQLAWAGFEAASGLDQLSWLGRGVISDLDLVLRLVVRRLLDDLGGDPPVPPRRISPAKEVSLRSPIVLSERGMTALIPFDSAAGSEGRGAAEIISDLALAALHRRGVRLAQPGMVEEVLRQREVMWRGGVDRLTRAALKATTDASLLLTGTVEAYELKPGNRGPNPGVAFSARVLDVETGRILWIGGQDRRGGDSPGFFGRRWIYSPGRLAGKMMESLLVSLEGPTDKR